MRPKLVRVARTFNLGNFQSVRLEWEVELSEGENLLDISNRLLEMLDKKGREEGWIMAKP